MLGPLLFLGFDEDLEAVLDGEASGHFGRVRGP
jgi:hypothetical protein